MWLSDTYPGICSRWCQPSNFWPDSLAFLPAFPLHHGNVPLFCANAEQIAPNVCSKPQSACNWTCFRNLLSIPAKIASQDIASIIAVPVFWGAIYFSTLYPCKKISWSVGLSNRLAFGRTVPLLTWCVPLKRFWRLADLMVDCFMKYFVPFSLALTVSWLCLGRFARGNCLCPQSTSGVW